MTNFGGCFMELLVLKEAHTRSLRMQGRSPDTIRFYGQAYKELEQFLGAGHPGLADVERLTRTDFYALMHGMSERGCVPGGVHATMRGLRAIFNWAFEEDMIEKNPVQKVKMPSVPRKLQPAVQPDVARQVLVLTEEDGKFKSRNRAIVTLMYDTGLRLSEVAELELGDIDLKDGVVTVQAGKGGHMRRVPFGNEVVKTLSKYLRDRKPKIAGEQRLWLGRTGDPLTKWGVILMLDDYAERLKIDRSLVAPHAWRRGFAVEFLRNGGEMFALQQILGHTNLEMTRKYVNYLPGDLKKNHTVVSPMDRLSKK